MEAQTTTEVQVGEQAGRLLAVARFEGDLAAIGQQMADAFGTVAEHLEQAGTVVTGPAYACYEISPDGIRVAAGFPVTGDFVGDGTVEPLRLPAGAVISCLHVGPYETLPKTYDRLRAAARAHGRQLDEGLMWEEYLTGPGTSPEETLTRVSWPLLPL